MTETTVEAVAEKTPSDAGQPAQPWPHPRQAWYAVGILSLTLLVNFLDRGILTLLVEPIKRDLSLSDTQISLVMGFAFVVFYVLLGLPIARLIDIGSRRVILGAGVAIWSVATALCGLASNFVSLFAFRVGVGVGEACTGPATFSILSDLFPREKLPRAIAVLNLGFMTGTGLALIIGGAVVQFLSSTPTIDLPLLGTIRSWQAAFFIVGVPGLIVAALVSTIVEPQRRGLVRRDATGRAKAPPISEVVAYLLSNWKVYGPLFLGLALKTILSFGGAMWLPTFYVRRFGWDYSQIGYIQGTLWLLVAPLGAWFGAWLAERFAKAGRDDANMRVVFWSSICLIPVTALYPMMPEAWMAVIFATMQLFVASWVLGPQNAAIQIITPNQMRGQVTALFLFVFNVVGFGFGPTFVALITDNIYRSDELLHYSLTTTALVLGPLATLVIWWGLKHYGRAVERTKSWE